MCHPAWSEMRQQIKLPKLKRFISPLLLMQECAGADLRTDTTTGLACNQAFYFRLIKNA